ncbi:glycoside hydrolase family 1 protein [Clostridium fallax]|uniref:6-phospho-beta-glucosidase n=1 Tax=Clostridium fallax TaxID=1533 RepID=A0A1M4ST77_9CLOT|nr:glycoside hydrolase family 1 protein [Clostridium fallax]SHE35378.1 6-phospho-beta-glucosidase [Clostridium fallax]SQB07958.1 6-phospho-beta-glucosidase [Clostridium fallax]
MGIEYKFPRGFWWGAASSATQMEGASKEDGKGQNIWDYWYSIEPEKFFNKVGPEKTTDFYHKYKEDIKRMKNLGFNSFRTSISWSRLIPKGKGKVNEEAVKYYNSVIDEMIENGIEPFYNLYHFDMPMELQKIGGFENREVVEAYADYAEICFKLFGDRVKKWFTFNEPIVPVEFGYLDVYHYPCVIDMKRAVQVAYNSVIASSKAIERFKTLQSKSKKSEIGIILNLTPSYPRSNSKEDMKASNLCDLMFNRSFLDTSVKGEFPKELIEFIKENNLMPETYEGDLNLIKKNTVDLLGVNYYQPRRVKAKETPKKNKDKILPTDFFDNYDMPGKKMNPYRGWEIYEKGIYDIMINLKENYGNIKSYISENGMGVESEERFIKDGIIQDDYRIDFIKDHLKWLYKAISEGANCRGYHLWTFIDNWSWLNAYKNRYGFYSLNLKTEERTIKKSGKWFKEVTRNNGF